MRLEHIAGCPKIVLSKRNLLALLHKVDEPASSKTLISPNRDCVVVVEPDDIHYANESRGKFVNRPGEMHPLTEAFIKENS